MSDSKQTGLPTSVSRFLQAARRRLRTYVWLQGVALTIVLLGAAFWAGFLWDWLFEPSAATRRVVLALTVVAAAVVVYRQLLRRVLVSISDESLALLLERRFRSLKDHVLTAVHLAATPQRAASYDPQLVAQTNQAAEAAVAGVQVGKLFEGRPLLKAMGAAALLVASIGLFAAMSTDVFGFYLKRIALSEEAWPRRVHLEVVGFPADAVGRRVQKVAQDDDFELIVHAAAGAHVVPKEVEIRFQLADGRRGRDTMIRVGEVLPGRDKVQVFRYEFKRVAAEMTFDVVGGDDRVRDLEFKVVDRPELFAVELQCDYPAYLGWSPRRLPVTGGMQIPQGTRLTLHAASTKPLALAEIRSSRRPEASSGLTAGQSAESIRWEYGTLAEDDVLFITIGDVDGIASRQPYRVSLSVVPDELPQVAVRPAGISVAVTPNAVIPIVGKAIDDYGLREIWYEYHIDGGRKETTMARPSGDARAVSQFDPFDLRAVTSREGGTLELKPGQKLSLSLKASDRFDLSDETRVGSSQEFLLDVVTDAELLALIERRELALRQRFEAIYEKMTDTRNMLGRIGAEAPPNSSGDEADSNASAARGESSDQDELPASGEADGDESPGDTADLLAMSDGGAPDDADDPTPPSDSAPSDPESRDPASHDNGPSETAAARALARTRLRLAGALQNVTQSADEVLGVAEGFDDLDAELTNNRIDNPDLQSRLREQISRPLHQISQVRLPELAESLRQVESQVQQGADAGAALDGSLVLADQILVEMREVLDRMLELETYNEVVALLRGIISDQEEINRRTKERQRDRIEDLFQ